MTSTRLQVLLIYKKLLREGRNFTDYNFRTYALNKVRNEFRANKNVSDPARIKELLKEAGENLKMMERQCGAYIAHPAQMQCKEFTAQFFRGSIDWRVARATGWHYVFSFGSLDLRADFRLQCTTIPADTMPSNFPFIGYMRAVILLLLPL
ncbi:hypothetical protein BaRGS_00014924 [Batillaria attramentaria]|uniref:Complex 1 LYR protein domain-containing protein n=1 Tax=Batillaria attramentaria TaxID=370345 RepID=A0ABD0L388_9CAEN